MTEQTTPASAPRLLNRRPRPQAPAEGAHDAGAVLRRRPPAGGPPPTEPGRWHVQPVRPRPVIVDTMDGPPAGHPSRIVDNMDDQRGSHDVQGARRAIVDTMDRDDDFASLPAAPEDPVPVRLKAPGGKRVIGPSGPDDDRVRRLRDAQKEKVAARAKARGIDPGAGSKPSTNGLTRSEKTHAQYLDRGRMLVKRYRREAGLSQSEFSNVNPIEFVNWLFSLKPTLTPSTWRPYRQSAKAILSTMPHDDVEEALALIDADIAEGIGLNEKEAAPKKQPTTRTDGLPRRTSGLKAKSFGKADFDRMLSFLRHFSRSRLAPVVVDWMLAGLSTGLRPIEWQATDVEVREDINAPRGRYVWLYVLNAKATNGRGNGAVRTLDISHFRDETIEAIKRMSERGAAWLMDGTYDTMQSQCSQIMYAASDKLFPGRKTSYALYSLRHQFVANSKSIHTPESVSALVGHVVTGTAEENYGRKNSSWAPEEIVDRAVPVPEEVSTVRQRLRFYDERIRLQQEAGLIVPPKHPKPE